MRIPMKLAFLLAPCLVAVGAAPPPELLTVAEKSEYRATAHQEDLVALLDALAAASPLARRTSLGKTNEGREIEAIVLSDPAVSSAEEAWASHKPVALLIGNIHAGEVDGKEGLPILARDLLVDPDEKGKAILREFVVVLVPNYNADGNERFAKDNRPGQLGPEDGMGVRENAQSLDLNRDFVKLEAPETRALVRAFNEWDPTLFIDCHTTNGSHHRYLITYAGPKHPGGDSALIDFTRGKMLPTITERLRGAGIETFWYGNFEKDHTLWTTYPCVPRYGVNYFGLRNRIGILSEGYSYAPYRDRVLGTRDFCRACLEYAVEHKSEILDLCRAADRGMAARRKEGAPIPIRTKSVVFPDKVSTLGFVEEEKDGKTVATEQTRDYTLELEDRFEGTLSVTAPFAYVFPGSLSRVVESLQRHGVRVEELREDVEVDAETYTIDSATATVPPFQKHTVMDIRSTAHAGSAALPAGTMVVRLDQPLGALAIQLLEPSAEDGLAAWNFFDGDVTAGAEYPVRRIPAPAPLLTRPARRLVQEDPPAAQKTVTFEAAFESDKPPALSGSPIGGVRWAEPESNGAPDEYIVQRDGATWRVDAATGRARPAPALSGAAGALRKLDAIGEKAAATLANSPLAQTADRKASLYSFGNDLYWALNDGSEAYRLTSTPGEERLASISPDGRFVAFVRGYDLSVVDVATRTERALTTDGDDSGDGIRNGINTWVYYEEVFNRDWRAYWWSPDSRRIAFYRTDPSPIPRFTIVDDTDDEQTIETASYPKPGEPNPVVTLGVVGVEGSEPVFMDLAGYPPADTLLTGVFFLPDSSRVGAYVQNRTQTWLDVAAWPAGAEGPRSVLFHETTQAWVEPPPTPEFLEDGSFLFFSERTGFKHLYRYKADGTLAGQVTGADPAFGEEWECRALQRVDQKGGFVYFTGTADSPIAQNLYRVKLDGTGMERLTTPTGDHSVSISPGNRYFSDTVSSLGAPPTTTLRALEGDSAGRTVRTLDSNPVYELEEYRLGEIERVQVPTRDGFPMEALIIKPSAFDPTRKYPVWLTTYAGPSAPTVRDNWLGGRLWERALAEAGVVVFNIDPRPASGKGVKNTWTAYKQLGVQELMDLEDAVDWLAQRPYIDAGRVGLAGHSYGGFMTAYALTHSTKFAAGISGSPVTDWADYDSIYTERYMLTPAENPDGYAKTSCTSAAKNLHGRLLLLHGTMDDNVHLQNSMRLVSSLQRAAKQFDFMVYPGSRHGIGGRHYRRMMYEFIVRTLVPEGGSRPAEPSSATVRTPQPTDIAGHLERSHAK